MFDVKIFCFMYYCESCGNKKFFTKNDLDNLLKINRIPVQKKIRKEDVYFKEIKQKPLVKCEKCGRGVVLKKIYGSYKKAMDKKVDEYNKIKSEQEMKKRLEDGKPPVNEKDEKN